MAYKFQLGSGSLGGSMRVGPVVGTGSVSGTLMQGTAGTLTSLALQEGGITAAGAIAGATTIDASGDLTVGTITMAEFTVAANGNTDVDGTLNVEGVPTFQAAAVFSSGISAAGAIAGATTIDASGDLTVGTITMSEFTVAANGNTDIDGTLNVEGVPTFQAAAVFSAGIGTANAIAGATTISGTLLDGTTIGGTSLNLQSGGGTDMGALSGVTTLAMGGALTGVTTATLSGLLSSSAKANFIGASAFGSTVHVTGAISGAAAVAGATGQFRGSVAETPTVSSDSLAWFETDGTLKQVTFALYATELAGTGITATNGVLSVDTSGGDSVTVTNLAVSGTAVAGINYMATISSSVSVKLPASPTAGDVVYVKAGAGLDPTAIPVADISIECQGDHKADNEAAIVIESPYGSVGLIYVAANLWRII